MRCVSCAADKGSGDRTSDRKPGAHVPNMQLDSCMHISKSGYRLQVSLTRPVGLKDIKARPERCVRVYAVTPSESSTTAFTQVITMDPRPSVASTSIIREDPAKASYKIEPPIAVTASQSPVSTNTCLVLLGLPVLPATPDDILLRGCT